jgi:CheY-like chemotaxis protein
MRSTILIVDDNPDLLSLYERSFPVLAEDLHVVVARDGEQGLTMFYDTSPRPACVVIDVKMPELNGNELTRGLRGDPDTADVPLIILTAMAQKEYRFQGMAAGADVYLTKPVSPHDLIVAIRQVVAIDPAQRQRSYQDLVDQALAEER